MYTIVYAAHGYHIATYCDIVTMWQKQYKAIIDDYTQYLLYISCVFSFRFDPTLKQYTSFMSTTTDMKTPSDEGKEKASERVLLRLKPRSTL